MGGCVEIDFPCKSEDARRRISTRARLLVSPVFNRVRELILDPTEDPLRDN